MADESWARIDGDLYAAACFAGEIRGVSPGQQLVRWARIGMEVDRSLAGVAGQTGSDGDDDRYDDMDPLRQAVTRAEWATGMETARTTLDLAAEFEAAGLSWVESGDDGTVVVRSRAEAARHDLGQRED